MKKVFSSNSQLCHVWAQQNQDFGRGNNMFFQGTDIYSYGNHYLAARIHTVKGKKIALVNSYRYSPSTGKHLSLIRDALHGLMPQYSVSDVTNLRKASQELDNIAVSQLKAALRLMKVRSTKHELAYIQGYFFEASEFRKLIGKKALKPDAKLLKEVKAHLKKRAKRTAELEAPKRAEREKRNEENRKAYESKKVELIEKFRNGETVWIDHMDTELLQVVGDTVRTSRGAEVPLRDAMALYRAIEAGKSVLGAEIGSFTVVSVRDIENDKIVKIGCHEILLSEAKQVLSLKVA